jgi:hypothetical protein
LTAAQFAFDFGGPHVSATFEEINRIIKVVQYGRNNVIRYVVLKSEATATDNHNEPIKKYPFRTAPSNHLFLVQSPSLGISCAIALLIDRTGVQTTNLIPGLFLRNVHRSAPLTDRIFQSAGLDDRNKSAQGS